MQFIKGKNKIKATYQPKQADTLKREIPKTKKPRDEEERMTDVGEVLFESKKIDQQAFDKVILENQSFRYKVGALENRIVDLKKQVKNKNKKEEERYQALYPYWEKIYGAYEEQARGIANELRVNPFEVEYGENKDSFDEVLKAMMKVMYFLKPQLVSEEENNKRKKEISELNQEIQSMKEKSEEERNYYESEIKLWKEKYLQVAKDLQNEKKKGNVKISVGSGVVTLKENKSDTQKETPKEAKKEAKKEQPETEEYPEVFQKVDELDDVVGMLEQELGDEIAEATKTEENEQDFDPEDDIIMLELKKHYNIAKAEKKEHDCIIEYENRQVPARIFKEQIEDDKIFDRIMEDTDEILLISINKDVKVNMNSKFTRWRLLSGRKNSVKYSFTSFDELKIKGLNKIS